MDCIKLNIEPQARTRMFARLLENQTLDAWMTFEFMEAAIKWVENCKPLELEWASDEVVQTRDQWSSTSAQLLHLENHPVDSFYNFQSISVNAAAAMRHQNRPDGMFLLNLTTTMGEQEMALFYEGDAHAKDEGKNLTTGCMNNHKMYQAIAQAQSKNEHLAGCIIIAAMKDSPTDKLMIFLDDMLKAHIFVCIAIADWNKQIREERRKATFIGNLFGNSLNHSMQYDFVFGINIGLHPGDPGWQDAEFQDRITKMTTPMGLNPVDIRMQQQLRAVAPFSKMTTMVGCVRIAICAIPRQRREVLGAVINNPIFIYPLHIDAWVTFPANGQPTTVTRGTFSNALLHTNAINVNLTFQKNMMRVTSVTTQIGGQLKKNEVRLGETNGFFHAALPLAYYTIQQFAFVSEKLKYEWSPTRYDFKKLLVAFKTNEKNLTGDVQVTMFKKNQLSLFHVLCASVDEHLPQLSEDFKLFLKDCCRWRVKIKADDPEPEAGSSPTIIFRTLGIYSLQNAIDFACGIQSNTNKTYSSLLASYPVGAQILIQQCMTKLSGNEAYAYIGCDASIPTPIESVDPKQDGHENGTSGFVNKLLDMEKNILTKIFHSTWSVTWDAPADLPATGSDREDDLAMKLIAAYQESITSWKCQCQAWVFTGGTIPSEELRRMLTGKLTTMQILPDIIDNIIDLHVPARFYEPKVDYAITCKPRNSSDQKYLCSAECPGTLNLSSYTEQIEAVRGAQYHTMWGTKHITFTLESTSVMDSIIEKTKDFADQIYDMLTKIGQDDVSVNGQTASERLLKLIEAQEQAQQVIAANGNAVVNPVAAAPAADPVNQDVSERLLALAEAGNAAAAGT